LVSCNFWISPFNLSRISLAMALPSILVPVMLTRDVENARQARSLNESLCDRNGIDDPDGAESTRVFRYDSPRWAIDKRLRTANVICDARRGIRSNKYAVQRGSGPGNRRGAEGTISCLLWRGKDGETHRPDSGEATQWGNSLIGAR
jgi:hypothetical protein